MRRYRKASMRRLSLKPRVYIRDFAWAACGKCIIVLCILVQQFENFVAIVSLLVSAAKSTYIE